MAFDAKNYSIGDILSRSVFSIPRNQRRYVWKKENWQDLFDDVLFSVNANKPHFLGSIVLDGTDEKKEGLSYFTIIDGQQRISTIVLFLIAVMKHFSENKMSDAFQGTVSYLKSKNDNNIDKMVLNSDYHLSIERFITGIIDSKDADMSINVFVKEHTISNKDKCIGDAVQFFYEAIQNDVAGKKCIKERLLSIRSAILDMTAVRIISTSEEDAYTIFEILNARGQALDDHELLKNYIMRHIQPSDKRDDAKSKWEEMERVLGNSLKRFIKHYATHRFGDTKEKYDSTYHVIRKATRGQNINDLFDDIILKAKYYNRIIHPSDEGVENASMKEKVIFGFFNGKRFEQFRPILLSLIHQLELERIEPSVYEATLEYIYNFYVCFTIIGEEKSNRLEDTVFKHARVLEEHYSDQALRDFDDELKKKMPPYEWYLNAFRNIGWSNRAEMYKGSKNKKRAQIVLEVVERHVAWGDTSRLEYTIEHLLPDDGTPENAQIGNLIPLEEKLNRKGENKSLSEKKTLYKESSFATARRVAERYDPKLFFPKSRTEYLAKLLYDEVLKIDAVK